MRPDGLLELFLCHSERFWITPLPPAEALSAAEGEESRRWVFLVSSFFCVIPSVAEGPRFLPCRVSVTPPCQENFA